MTTLLGLAMISMTFSGCIRAHGAPSSSENVQSKSSADTAAPTNVSPVHFDLQNFIDQRVAAGDHQIIIPPGAYYVTPHDRQHLLLKGLSDVQIIADGVKMICTQTTRALTISDCRNVTVRGLTIDYDPLPFTQGRITAMSADRSVHEVELFAGYPHTDQLIDRYEIFSPQTRTLVGPHYGVKFQAIDPTHVRVTKLGASSADAPERVGDLVVITTGYAPGGSIAHTVTLDHCSQVRLEHVTVYGSNCFGFLEDDCDQTVYDHCAVDRCPPELELAPRGDPRLRSTDADAFHSNHAVVGPQLLGCIARYQGDDCLNICGTYHMVMASDGATLRVLADGRMNISVGDPVEICTYQGERLPDARVLHIVPDGDAAPDERAFVLRQKMNEQIRTKSLVNAYAITLDRPVQLPMGSIICSLRHAGSGFLVKDCTFGFNRSRGILIKASDGQVVGNTIVGSQMSAILVSPEYWWLEAGSSNNVLIADNTIRSCEGVAIRVEAEGGSHDIAPAGAHNHIEIRGNHIDGCGYPAIYVTSTDGLVIENNAGTLAAFSSSTPSWSDQKQSAADRSPIQVVNCAHQTIQQNELTIP